MRCRGPCWQAALLTAQHCLPPASLPDPVPPSNPDPSSPEEHRARRKASLQGEGSSVPPGAASEHSRVLQGLPLNGGHTAMKRWPRGPHTASSQPTESEGSPPGHTLILVSLISVLQEQLAFWPRAQGLRFSVHLQRRGVKWKPKW